MSLFYMWFRMLYEWIVSKLSTLPKLYHNRNIMCARRTEIMNKKLCLDFFLFLLKKNPAIVLHGKLIPRVWGILQFFSIWWWSRLPHLSLRMKQMFSCFSVHVVLRWFIFKADFAPSITKYFAEIIYNFDNGYFFHIVVRVSLCSAVNGKYLEPISQPTDTN